MEQYNPYVYMSYSNGKLPEETISHGKIIEIVKGLPGVGFKLTDDGDYDIQNKKLRNVASPQTNNDATTKSYVDNKALLVDGSNKMLGALDMNSRRIENVAPGRHNTADALTHLQFEAFYYDLNTDSGFIEAQSPIDMKNEKISNLAEGTDNSDAITKHQLETGLAPKADKTELASYLKRDGSISVTSDFDFGDNKITKVGNGSQSTDVVNKGYIDTALAAKPNVNQVILRDGSQDMTGNLNMSQKKIVNLADPIGINDATGKGYVDRLFLDSLRLDGSSKMTGNLDMNNQQIKNVKDATHNQDAITLKQVNDAIATTSTKNNKYTDQKIAESHISTHENRKNVLAYAMDDGEFTKDAGIQDVNLIDFNDMPHKTNKKAFSMKVQRTNDGSSEYKGRFDFNLFKLIRDNFSDHYTVCLETYFQKSPFYDYEFGSTVLSFEALNINIDTGLTVKVNSEYKYLRTILNLSPDGTSKQIQRRLYVNFKSNFDNSSPVLLPIFVLIYGIKDEAKSDLDMTIYDYEKAYEVANNEFQLHVPINMNNNGITGLPRSPIDDNSPLTRTYMRLVSLPCFIMGVTEIGNRYLHFSYKMQIDGTTTYMRLANIFNKTSIHVIKVMIQSNIHFNGLIKLFIGNANFPYVLYNVSAIMFNINRTFNNSNQICIETRDNKRRIIFYTIYYRPYNF